MALAPGVGWGQRAQTADELPAAVATAWFDVLYDVVKTNSVLPPRRPDLWAGGRRLL